MSKQVNLPPSLERHRVLSFEKSAEAFGYSVAHLRRMHKTGKIPPPIQIGGRKQGYTVGMILDIIEAASNRGAA